MQHRVTFYFLRCVGAALWRPPWRIRAQELAAARDGVSRRAYPFADHWFQGASRANARINKACERIVGVRSEDVVGKNMAELIALGLIDQSVTLRY